MNAEMVFNEIENALSSAKGWPDEKARADELRSLRQKLLILSGNEAPWLDALEALVIGWAKDRKIIPNAKPESQVLKAVSEMGELADAVLKGQDAEMRDAIGDVVVCLINLCALKGTSLGECLSLAYDQIKDRKGTLLPNGCFVKEEAK